MSAKLQWQGNNEIETGFRVYRADASMDLSDMPTPLAELPADTEEYTDDTTLDGATYYYIVSAFNANDEKFSAEVQYTQSGA